MNKPEQQLKRLFEYNQEINRFEFDLEGKKLRFKQLQKEVRSDAQKLHSMIQTLRKMML